MRVAPSGEKPLSQGNDRRVGTGRLRRVGTRLPGREDDRVAERTLQPDSQRTREHEFLVLRPVLAECMISGVLSENAAEICFRAKVAGRDSGVDCAIATFGGFQIVIALVANIGESGLADPYRQRK